MRIAIAPAALVGASCPEIRPTTSSVVDCVTDRNELSGAICCAGARPVAA
ncbi:hypothetical protein [Pseudonocardia endophytica]|nr:hypothetical protein [Pseudonocardia endophytica]